MAMTMQGEVALKTVDTVVRAAPGLPAHSAAFQSFEKVSDAARDQRCRARIERYAWHAIKIQICNSMYDPHRHRCNARNRSGEP